VAKTSKNIKTNKTAGEREEEESYQGANAKK
jgi:hypothetical protein